MTDELQKPYPAAAGPIAGMFGIQRENIEENESTSGISSSSPTSPPPKDLPVIEAEAAKPVEVTKPAKEPQHEPPHEPKLELLKDEQHEPAELKETETEKDAARDNAAWKMTKTILPYLVVFIIGVLVYYFYFSNTDFSSWLHAKPESKVAGAQTSKGKALADLEQAQLKPYQAWIGQFYFDVSDPKITDPETDFSGNGLTNFQKYLLNLNPKAYDSVGNGTADGITVANGNDPATGQPLTGARKDIVDKYFDTQAIRDRVTSANLNGTGSGMENNAPVSVNSPTSSGTTTAPIATTTTPDSTSMTAASNETATAILPRGVESANQSAGQASSQSSAQSSAQPPSTNKSSTTTTPKIAPVAGAGDTAQYENALNINTSIPAELKIPKLGVTAPLYFSKSVDSMYTDLKNGVAHLTGTPLPGDHGTSYIVGHSSNYPWVISKYKKVFAPLNKLVDGDTFTVTVTLNGGQKRVITYKVAGHGLYLPDDQSQFINYAASRMALSTCWPLNTTQKRLVVFGEVTSVK